MGTFWFIFIFILISYIHYKSPGVEYGESALLIHVERLFKKIWEEEEIPEDWLKGVVVVLAGPLQWHYECS